MVEFVQPIVHLHWQAWQGRFPAQVLGQHPALPQIIAAQLEEVAESMEK